MLIKKLFLAVLLLIFCISLFKISAFAEVEISISAKSAVVINADTKEIVYQKNAFERRSMASTTKIMTTVLALESGKLKDVVTVGKIKTEGSSVDLKQGDKLTLEALVYGMMLESGNDAAEVTADFLSGSEEAFSALMNEKAAELGMHSTNFVTASGLDDENHYSTAYDMALLGAYAIKNPVFRKICSDDEEAISFTEPQKMAYFTNHNKLLSYCDGVFGIKTGFTKKSGRCLVTACKRDGTTLVAVTLGAPDDWNDHEKLFKHCFELLHTTTLTTEIPQNIKVYGSFSDTIGVKVTEDKYIYSFCNKSDISKKILLPKLVYAPIKSGDIIGSVNYYIEDTLIHSSEIIALDNAEQIQGKTEKKKTIIEKITDKIKSILI